MNFKELPKKWKRKIVVLSAVIVVLFLAIVMFNIFLASYRKSCADMRAVLVKDEKDLIGERIEIERDNKASVKANIYIPDKAGKEPLPVIFNIHGGGFVGGDADVLDTQSDRIANEWNAIIITVNYTKADVKPIPYGSEEIKDAVLYIAENAEKYNADITKIYIMGYSAGAYYAAESTRMLQENGFKAAGLVLCYPWTTGLNADKLDIDFTPTLFVFAGQDPISQKAKPYAESMKNIGIEVETKEYENAVHSFIESNNPEGADTSSEDMGDVINSEQEKLAREAERFISEWISAR